MIKPETIKDYRKTHGLTQAQLADLCNVSRALVRLTWEKTGIPARDITKATGILEILNWSIENE